MSLETCADPAEQSGEASPMEIRQPFHQPIPGAARQVTVRRRNDGGEHYYVGIGQGRLYLSHEAAEALLIALAKMLLEPRFWRDGR